MNMSGHGSVAIRTTNIVNGDENLLPRTDGKIENTKVENKPMGSSLLLQLTRISSENHPQFLPLKQTQSFKTQVALSLPRMQLIQGTLYMRTNNVIHRDLKLGNLFLSRTLEVKIGDLGLASKLDTAEDRRTTICGTPNSIAPEIIDGKKGGNGNGHLRTRLLQTGKEHQGTYKNSANLSRRREIQATSRKTISHDEITHGSSARKRNRRKLSQPRESR